MKNSKDLGVASLKPIKAVQFKGELDFKMKFQIMTSLNSQKEAASRSTRKALQPGEEAIQPHLMEALSRQQLQALMEL